MQYRSLGKSGLELSIIGFGASPLGNEFGEADEKESVRAVHYAIEQGISYFDTAPYYGRGLSEERLGKALKGFRDKVILATKVGRYDKNTFDFSAPRVRQSLEESLRRLETDRIDLLQVHDIEFGDREQIVSETLPALLELKTSGQVRAISITGYPLHHLKTVAEAFPEIDAILSYCHYNLLDTAMDDVLTPYAQEKALGLINASPLHMRALTQQGAPDWHPAPKKVIQKAREAAALCQAQGADLARLVMQFALQHPYVSSTLVGMNTVEQVKQNLATLEDATHQELLKEVKTLLAPVHNSHWTEGRPEYNDPGAVPKGS
ncbi:MAG: aldo/keto reductase [Trueperaceae bacterium]|nr:aldo/keto reductase [Trueperaceae bacterium]